jgi:hypothetical protein
MGTDMFVKNNAAINNFNMFSYDWLYGFKRNFSYSMAVRFIGGGKRSTRENHQPVANHRQTFSYNVV